MKTLFSMLAVCAASAACAAPNPQPEKPGQTEPLAVSAAPEVLAQFRQFCPDGTPVLFLNGDNPRYQYFQVACREVNGETAYGFGIGRGR
ncbi:hypothetical protein A7P95_00630 [Eikenella longinqua]|uniref:Uncharacterized protein n=1 Tax=Eikenella longinqua TaxID=1795827 RepID=A0A1A9S1G4_9NEIS|nr:hypothetical protein [Eikenella longinqua]OAM31045.1 hypothetical protein A7P95_00630 [Eikenella longinqua]